MVDANASSPYQLHQPSAWTLAPPAEYAEAVLPNATTPVQLWQLEINEDEQLGQQQQPQQKQSNRSRSKQTAFVGVSPDASDSPDGPSSPETRSPQQPASLENHHHDPDHLEFPEIRAWDAKEAMARETKDAAPSSLDSQRLFDPDSLDNNTPVVPMSCTGVTREQPASTTSIAAEAEKAVTEGVGAGAAAQCGDHHPSPESLGSPMGTLSAMEPFAGLDACRQSRQSRGSASKCKSSLSSEPLDMSTHSRMSMSEKTWAMTRKMSCSIKNLVVGDDYSVIDKWDNYDDIKEEARRSKSFSERKPQKAPGLLHGGKVAPESLTDSHSSPSLSSASETSNNDNLLAANAVEDTMKEKRAARTLVWYYFQAFCVSVLLAAVCMPLVAAMSVPSYHESIDSVNVIDDAEESEQDNRKYGPIRPNHTVLQWVLLVQIVFPLCIYAALLCACIKRTFQLPKLVIISVAVSVSWAAITAGLFFKYDVIFWYYYGDLFLIVAAYVPCMCVVGWCVEDSEEATWKTRAMDLFFTGALETIVAASTLVYCLFIMPHFYTMTNAWLQMLWLCVIHPLYFEVTTGFIVRKVLSRNRKLGRNHVVYQLTIVHSMVHTVALTTSLQASIEPIRVLVLTLFLYNLSKLTWRSTVIQRDLLVERLFNGWSFNYSPEDLGQLARMVSVGILTEIILENASILITPFMMYRMYEEPIFMMVVPDTFFHNNGTYPIRTLISLISLLLGFTITFDIIFYFLNYNINQRLPLINTWRRIKKSQGWYLLFLIYGFTCMGVLFLFLTMLVLPRAAYCYGGGDNYCACTTLMYETICQGEYISTLVDYLVSPYG